MKKDLCNIFYLLVVIFVMIFGFAACIEAYSCGARWDGSGLASSWGLTSGCRIQTPDGRWLPDDKVREFDITPKAAK